MPHARSIIVCTLRRACGLSNFGQHAIVGWWQLSDILVQVSTGTGNTALVFHAKKLLALHEADCPYHVSVLLAISAAAASLQLAVTV